MCWLVKILFCVRMRHTRWITAHNVEVCTCSHSRFRVPLYLFKFGSVNTFTRYSKLKYPCTCKSKLHPTSVGPAYIIGDGKIAITVRSGSRIPSFMTALCCSIRTGSGTSSSFVHPPKEISYVHTFPSFYDFLNNVSTSLNFQ